MLCVVYLCGTSCVLIESVWHNGQTAFYTMAGSLAYYYYVRTYFSTRGQHTFTERAIQTTEFCFPNGLNKTYVKLGKHK